MGNDRDGEKAFLDSRDCQTDSVDCDGAFIDDVAIQILRYADAKPVIIVAEHLQ